MNNESFVFVRAYTTLHEQCRHSLHIPFENAQGIMLGHRIDGSSKKKTFVHTTAIQGVGWGDTYPTFRIKDSAASNGAEPSVPRR
jgi:Cu/Ag efflux protein CusF